MKKEKIILCAAAFFMTVACAFKFKATQKLTGHKQLYGTLGYGSSCIRGDCWTNGIGGSNRVCTTGGFSHTQLLNLYYSITLGGHCKIPVWHWTVVNL